MLPVLVDSCVKEAGQFQAGAQRALAEGRVADLRRAAHTLKSNARNFGAATLAGLCQTLEDLAKAEQLDGAAELLAQIGEECPRVCLALEELKAEAKGEAQRV